MSGPSSTTSTALSRTAPPLLVPTELREDFQVSVHSCPRLLQRELKHVFPAFFQDKKNDHEVLAVLTCQRSRMDLSQFGLDADNEKDRLLEDFVEFAQFVATKLIEQSYWADFIDPCSGLPVRPLRWVGSLESRCHCHVRTLDVASTVDF